MAAIIISLIALVLAIISIVVSKKKQTVKVTNTTVIEHAPAEHPFYYDEKRKVYTLDGTLKVTGGLSCMDKEKE